MESTDIFVHGKNRNSTDVRVRPDAEDKIRSWTGRVVSGSLVAKLVNKAILIKLQKLGYCPKDAVFFFLMKDAVFDYLVF